MSNQSKFQWSTGRVIALCLVLSCIAFYGGSKSKYFSNANQDAPQNTVTPFSASSNLDLSDGLQEAETDEEFTFVRVTDVSEGDVIRLADGTEVNLIGVSCPKLDETDSARLAIAREALAFTTGAVLEREVRLEYETDHSADNAGRTLAYVYLRDGSLLNAELIKRGYGNAFNRYAYRLSDDFRRLELAAKNKGIGLWEDREPTETVAESNDESSLESLNSSAVSESTNNSDNATYSTRPRTAEVIPSYNGSSTNGYDSSYTPNANRSYALPSYPSRTTVPSTPPVAENGSYYGQISERTGRPKTIHVEGYYRRDGTYVRGHYRSKGRR